MKVALVGNPNVGKSTLFNALTGLHQHTGNWPGKTVEAAAGTYFYHGIEFRLADLPGLYSLRTTSKEETLAAQYLSAQSLDCTVVVCDATCLARSLILAIQVMQLAKRMIICLNLTDEARRRGIVTDSKTLSALLGLPVVELSAGRREGIGELKRMIEAVCSGFVPAQPQMENQKAESTARQAAELAARVQTGSGKESAWRVKLDRLLLSRTFGYPAAFCLLLLVLWLTIWGANYPGIVLEWCFARLRCCLGWLLQGIEPGIASFLLDGLYDTLARVITVMLPPMAIFFPLFTVLEDFGFLPRLAFLLDRPFERCGACGKQALTACMSLGCNAVGVMGCRIIDSPKERLIAILTSSVIPCNGRFPTLIILVSVLFHGSSADTALLISGAIALSLCVMLGLSAILSKAMGKSRQSALVLELPPYRKPQLLQVLVRSVLERTVYVMGRALLVAVPAGAILWIMNHLVLGQSTLLQACAAFLNPIGNLFGMNGAILLAFLFGFPANELVLPVLVMILTGAGQLSQEVGIAQALSQCALSSKNIVCMLIFCLFHWPCAATLMTIKRETEKRKWVLWGFLLPTLVGLSLCAIINWI